MAQPRIDFEPEEESIDFEPIDFEPEEPEPGMLSRAWTRLSQPLTTLPSKAAKAVADVIDQPSLTRSPTMARIAGFGAGALEGIGDVVSGFTSPVNLGTAALTGGASMAAKAGLPAIARAATYGARGAGAMMAGAGGQKMYEGAREGDLPKIGMGAVEAAGGILGVKQKIPQIGKRIAGEVPPVAEPVITPPSKPAHRFEAGPQGVVDLNAPKTQFVEIRNPTPALVQKYRQEGYVSAGTTADGFPRMKFEGVKATSKTTPPKPTPSETRSQWIPFDREVTIKNPSAAVVKKMADQGFDVLDVTPEGAATFKFTKEPPPVDAKISRVREAWNLPRGLMSVDPPFVTSAAFRQAMPLAWSKEWFKSWGAAAKAYGDEGMFNKVHDNIKSRTRFQDRIDPTTGTLKASMADEAGLAMTELKGLSGREEALMSTIAEKIPVYGRMVRASNRSYTAFLNKLRADKFDSMMDDAIKLAKDTNNPALNPETNLTVAKEIASFINDATGRGSLSTKVPFTGKGTHGGKQLSLERSAGVLRETFFSPRLMASRMRLLQPQNYMTANPVVRKQYLKSMMTMAGTWMGMAGLAKIGGADVVLDPTNADFGKIKIGNTRLDPAAGFQQYLVLASRLARGETTSSTTEQTREFGVGYQPPTWGSTTQNFFANKLQPVAKLIHDVMFAEQYKPVHLADRTIELFLPMITSDLLEVLQDDPALAFITVPFAGVGGSAQTYERGTDQPTFTPYLGMEDLDITIPSRY